MHREHSITIAAPAETVWTLNTDVEAWPRLTPTTMSSVERLDAGELRVGSRARVKQPAQRATVWTVTELVPCSVFRWQTSVLGIRMVASHQLVASATGCTNTLSIDLLGRGAEILGRIAGKRILAAITTENECFKRAAESAHVS